MIELYGAERQRINLEIAALAELPTIVVAMAENCECSVSRESLECSF